MVPEGVPEYFRQPLRHHDHCIRFRNTFPQFPLQFRLTLFAPSSPGFALKDLWRTISSPPPPLREKNPQCLKVFFTRPRWSLRSHPPTEWSFAEAGEAKAILNGQDPHRAGGSRRAITSTCGRSLQQRVERQMTLLTTPRRATNQFGGNTVRCLCCKRFYLRRLTIPLGTAPTSARIRRPSCNRWRSDVSRCAASHIRP
jgi:hypothetical protein